MHERWAQLGESWVIGRVRRREITALTGRNHRSALTSFLCVVGNRRTIRRSDVERWLEKRAHLAEATRRSDLSTVRGWCRWLVEERHLKTDPTKLVASPKEPRRMPRYIEQAGIDSLLDVSPDARTTAVIWLMFGAGLRCCEVAGVRVEDWDRAGQTIRVIGKGGHEREVPIPREVAGAITWYLASHPATTGPLIRSYRQPHRALTPDTLSGQVSELMRAAGIKHAARDGMSAHALRHTCASDTLEASGGNLWLGHANLNTVKIYLRHARSDEMRRAIDARFAA
jgi:integrase/recombinase XerC